MKIDCTIATKRLLLSSIAKIFDQLGLVSPVTVSGKALFQDLFRVKYDWDDELPVEKCNIWEELVRDSDAIKSVSVSRSIHCEKYHWFFALEDCIKFNKNKII